MIILLIKLDTVLHIQLMRLEILVKLPRHSVYQISEDNQCPYVFKA